MCTAPARRALQRWQRMHRWSSLACTALLLLLCLTGLPLVFADEIEVWDAGPPQRAARTRDEPLADIDALVAAARQRHPQEVVRFVFIDDAEAAVKVVLAPADSPSRARDHRVSFDARTGALLDDEPPPGRRPTTFMGVATRLHTDLFAGLAGELLLAGTGLLFLVAMVSGTVLYGPYMQKLRFGTVRAHARRLRWLDLHNLLGICVLAWALVVGATGTLNALAKPLSAWWRGNEMAALLGTRGGEPLAMQPTSARRAYETVRQALPGRNVTSLIFPSASFANPGHYLVWTNGDSPLTARLFTAALVDARSGTLAAVAQMPAYLRLLQLSRPLHFGDYGGLPLKLLWAALDLATIAVLGSGLYLWVARRRRPRGLPGEAGDTAPGDPATERHA